MGIGFKRDGFPGGVSEGYKGKCDGTKIDKPEDQFVLGFKGNALNISSKSILFFRTKRDIEKTILRNPLEEIAIDKWAEGKVQMFS